MEKEQDQYQVDIGAGIVGSVCSDGSPGQRP